MSNEVTNCHIIRISSDDEVSQEFNLYIETECLYNSSSDLGNSKFNQESIIDQLHETKRRVREMEEKVALSYIVVMSVSIITTEGTHHIYTYQLL